MSVTFDLQCILWLFIFHSDTWWGKKKVHDNLYTCISGKLIDLQMFTGTKVSELMRFHCNVL